MSAGLFNAARAYEGVILALALGLLVGVERGWSRRDETDGACFAGIRTFGLLGLVGGISGELITAAPALSVILLGGSGAILVAGYVRSSQSGQDISGTSAIVGIVTLGTGVLAASGQAVLACVIAATATLILSSRRQMHAWLVTLTEPEVQALARFALIALAILPVLPDQDMGLFLAWNPRRIWLVVVLVSGFSFAGYIAVRRLGTSRGTIAAAAAGAMVSSTAVTAALASQLRRQDAPVCVLNAAIAATSSIMFLRVLVLSTVLVPWAFPSLAILLLPPAFLIIGWTGWRTWRCREAETLASAAAPVRNPFDLLPALVLAALVAVLSLAAHWLQLNLGQAGLGAILALSGMVDVDSAIMTMSGLPRGLLDARLVGLILSAPVMLNMLVKAAITIGIAGWRSGWLAALPLGLCVAIYLAAGLAAWQAGWL